jgi:hypothetical protein
MMRDPVGPSLVLVSAELDKERPGDKDLPHPWKCFGTEADGTERYQRVERSKEIIGRKGRGG